MAFILADVKFSDTYGRIAADKMLQTYFWAKAALLEWNQGDQPTIATDFANNSGVTVPDTSTNTPLQGSGPDGRTSVTGSQITIVMSNLQAFVNVMEANSNLVLNQYAQVSVNP